MEKYYRTYAEVSLKAIEHNVEEAAKRILPGTKILAIVKADAYGHGAVRVAKDLENRVDFYGVATLEEGIELYEAGIRKPTLCLGYISPREFGEMIRADIRPSIFHRDDALALDREAEKLGKKAKYHIALDTGMTRIGFQVTEKDADTIAEIAALPHIELEGMFTHLSCCDQQDQTYSKEQFARYDRMLAMLKERNVRIPIRHVSNSAAVEEFGAQEPHRFDMVRLGITNYGCYPSEDVQKQNLDLIPALQCDPCKKCRPGRRGQLRRNVRDQPAGDKDRHAVSRLCGWISACSFGKGESSDSRPVCADPRQSLHGPDDG